MKKLLLLTLIVSIFIYGQSQDPSTSFETDFSTSGSANGNWGSIDEEADPQDYIFTVENGEMRVDISKTSWHFIQLWIKPFDLTGNPFMSFRMKSESDMDLSFGVKDDDGNIVSRSISLSSEWQDFFFNFSDDLSTWTAVIAEIQFDPGFGAFDGVFFVDDFKLGDAAVPELSRPTIDPIPNLLLQLDAGMQVVPLEGITAGGDPGQHLSVMAVSDNPDLIPAVNVSYSSPDPTGSLSFTPVAGQSGEATVTVTVRDDGMMENETVLTFKVLVKEYGGDGFLEDYESPAIDPLWDLANVDYTLTQSSGVMHIDAHKNVGWESFTRGLDGFYDLSANPVVNLDVRGEKPFVLHLYLEDAEGAVEMREARVMQSDQFVTTTFDFTGSDAVKLDRITGLRFAFNGYALNFDGEVWFDQLKLGSAALKMAYMASVPDHSCFISSGTQSVTLTDIVQGNGIIIASQGHVIENAAISEISNGVATLSFDIIPDAIGSDTVSLTVSGLSGYADYREEFIVSIEQNAPPVMDQVADVMAIKGDELSIQLSGIFDGNPSDEQLVTVTAASSDEGIISNPLSVSYQNGPYALLSFTPLASGACDIIVSLTDDGGGEADSSAISFHVDVYAGINNTPTINPVTKQNVFNDAGEVSLELTGISDGDDGNQGLNILAFSSVDSIIPNPLVIEYSGGETALLKYTPNASYTGISNISLKVVDEGGTPENNGNDSLTITFDIESRTAPLTGWVAPLGEGDLHDIFSAEEEHLSWFMSYVDSGAFNAIELRLENKWEFSGLWLDLPVELDLTDYPYISYEVYPVGNTLTKTVGGETSSITDTYHWNYLFDVNNERNILNNGAHQYAVPPDQWTTLSFDYSDPGDMQTSEGEEILTDRISDVLLNLHWRNGEWPFTDMSGTVYYRNIRIGDQAIVPAKVPICLMDQVPGQAYYVQSGEHTITLTGISNGKGSVDGIILNAFSGRSSILPDPVLGELKEDGTATLTMLIGEKAGSTPVTVTVAAEGSVQQNLTFDLDVVSGEVKSMTSVTIDRTERFQTMDGFGTFENERRWIDLYTTDLGASAVRIGLIENQIEPVNDNNDENVLDMESLNYDAIDFEYFRMLKETGVETFILTSWSPPAWMKTNLSQSWLGPNAEGSTEDALNRLEFHYYGEFAESMVAVVKMFEQEAGIHLEAIGLQNEPAFDEPYASAILDPAYFAELIEVVGKRFEDEGISTRLYMAEQVVGQYLNSNLQYLSALQDNPGANPYADIFAVHGYGEDGITPGEPTYSEWENYYEKAQLGDYPKKVWMTETHIPYAGWSSAMSNAGAIHGGLWAGNVSLWTNWSFGDMQLTKNVPNSTFYTSKNYFKYIRPGAVRISTSANHNDVLVSAFEHEEDGTFTVVLINKSNSAVSVELVGNNLPDRFSLFRTSMYEDFIDGGTVAGEMFILPASSVTTLYAGEHSSLEMDDLPNLFLNQNDPEQTVQLSGISNGEGGTASLILEAGVDDAFLLGDINVSDVQSDGTASLTFTPVPDMSGTSLITVTLSDGNETREVKFYVHVESTVGKQELEIQTLKVYPNPASDKLFVELPETGMDELTITDLMGRVLFHREVVSEQRVEINVNLLRKGMFIISVSKGQKRYVSRFMVE